MPLSDKQLKDVCLVTDWDASPLDICRYCNGYHHGGFSCVKLSKSRKKKVDANIATQIANGMDPSNIPSTGDNCQGYPYLPNVKQGYDI